MSSAGLEPAISAIWLPQVYASEHTVTGIGDYMRREFEEKWRLILRFCPCFFKNKLGLGRGGVGRGRM